MCGIAAVIDLEGRQDVVPMTVELLSALQHRGQLGAGIAWHTGAIRKDAIHVMKGMGLIEDVLSRGNLLTSGAEGSAAIAHTRYATTPNMDPDLCHPFLYAKDTHPAFAFAFNGNIPDYSRAEKKLGKRGIVPRVTESDTEIIGQSIVRTLLKDEKMRMRRAVIDTLGSFEGACNAIVLSSRRRIFATRDRHGFHPLVYAQQGSLVGVASESVAFHNDRWSTAEVHDIPPGHMLHIGPRGGVNLEQVWEPDIKRCLMEFAYFSEHRTSIDGVPVSNARFEEGKILAHMDIDRPETDIVVPVPESSKTAARGYADTRGVRNVEALLRRKGAKRTFIEADDRERKVREKFSLDADLVRDRSVVLVDDSLVRGTTMSVLVKMLREAGAREVHVRLASPAIIAPCFYGIYFPTVRELLARKYLDVDILQSDTLPQDVLDAIAQDVGADSVKFLPISGLAPTMECNDDEICRACVTGRYPTESGQRLYQLANASVSSGQ